MVLSRLNSTIEYTDKKNIEDIDKNINVQLYEIEVSPHTIMIAIGKYNKNKNIIFLPIYLFYNDKFFSQIGVF